MSDWSSDVGSSVLESAIRPERSGSFLPMPFRLMSMISYRWTNMRHNDQNQGPSVRVLRVGEQVRHVLSEILQRGDVHDDVLATHPVRVTEVRMSPDRRHATVIVNALPGRDEEPVLKELRTNPAKLKAAVASRDRNN